MKRRRNLSRAGAASRHVQLLIPLYRNPNELRQLSCGGTTTDLAGNPILFWGDGKSRNHLARRASLNSSDYGPAL